MVSASPLWTLAEIDTALQTDSIKPSAVPENMAVTGVSIDSRTTAPGDIFFAIIGPLQNGHDYIADAIAAGARAIVAMHGQTIQLQPKGAPVHLPSAVVNINKDVGAAKSDATDKAKKADKVGDAGETNKADKDNTTGEANNDTDITTLIGEAGICLFIVEDTLHALEQLGQAARQRIKGKVIAVTGSVGKTSVKEGLHIALQPSGATHVSAASHNNKWGVPLSLARMPADTEFAVFEVGMSHAGEIAALVPQIRPDLAIITRIAPAHIEYFDDLSAIAAAKAEIFSAMQGLRTALLPVDDDFYDYLKTAAEKQNMAAIFSFGESEQADARAISIKLHPHCSCLSGTILGQDIALRVGAPGRHMAINALAILAAVKIIGGDCAHAALAIGQMEALSGRGRRHDITLPDGICTLIDESYNANPESMRAALEMFGQLPCEDGRRIAVLGDMKEIGDISIAHHRKLAAPIMAAQVDMVFTLGEDMWHLYVDLRAKRKRGPACFHAKNLDQLIEILPTELHGGDVVMVKGSNAMQLMRLVDKLCALDMPAADIPIENIQSTGGHG